MDDTAIGEVLARYGLTVKPGTRAEVIEDGNQTATVTTDGGKVLVRRSHQTRTRPWLAMEAEVLAHLQRAGFPAVRQRRTGGGEAFIEWAERFWAVFDRPAGRRVDPANDGQLAELARLQGRLHAVLAKMPRADRHAAFAAEPRARKSWSHLVPLAATGQFLEQLDLPARLAAAGEGRDSAAVRKHVADCRKRIEAASDGLPPLEGQLTLCDYGQHAVVFGADGAATVADFDLLIWDAPAAGVARAMNVAARFGAFGPLLPVKAAAYLKAYHAALPLGAAELAALPALLRLSVLQQPIFHAMRHLETADPAWQARWAEVVGKDLARDDELTRLGDGWLAAAAGG
jgi:Ser/Thr protein kinase RdoA (MazF antagonist)